MAATSTREGPFVVIAEFDVKPDASRALSRACRARMPAPRSAKEPGCHQFDVTVEQAEPNRVVLYEVYEDEAAFDAHLQTPHLATFRDGIEPLVTGRKVRRLTRVHG